MPPATASIVRTQPALTWLMVSVLLPTLTTGTPAEFTRRPGPRTPEERGSASAHVAARQRALGFAHALRQGHEELARDARRLVQELLKARPADDEQTQVALRHDRGGARFAVEQTHLAEVLAGAEADVAMRRHLYL